MGNYGYLNHIEIHQSKLFLDSLIQQHNINLETVLDCGAGIGRVTQNLLVHYFQQIDQVEFNQLYIQESKNRSKQLAIEHQVRNYYNQGLQDFQFQSKYDVIWIQWVIGCLKDHDLQQFLTRCKHNLNEDGIIVIKDNVCYGDTEYDDDGSCVHNKYQLEQIIADTGLQIINQQQQTQFPDELNSVFMYALK